MSDKKLRDEATASGPEGFCRLPDTIFVDEILSRLDLNSLCSLSCVSTNLRSLASQSLSSISSLDLSDFSVRGELLNAIVSRLSGLKSVTLDCFQLDDDSIINVLGEDVRELNLLKCARLRGDLIQQIGVKCPNLRILNLELATWSLPQTFKNDLLIMMTKLIYLEHIYIKLRGIELNVFYLDCVDLSLPKSVKFLKLKPMIGQDITQYLEKLRDKKVISQELASTSISPNVASTGFTLQSLSLVLNVITDRLMIAISSSLPFLVELDLKDMPLTQPKLPYEMTSIGLQHLCSCQFLTSLSIRRSKVNSFSSFKIVDDMGMFLLSQSCSNLESVRLSGFSVVTDAGFSSIMRSCCKLKKFEVFDAPLLSDLAFNYVGGSLVDFKVSSCKLITSEALAEFASSSTLEVLDTNGCRSIADTSINYISCIKTLKSINLGGADITDSGLRVLCKADLPIVKLCLRGCARVTDRGIICLLNEGKRIRKTLSCLDIGKIPGVSDETVLAIVASTESITELSLRSCFHVTDLSIQALASKRSDGKVLLQKLDLCKCKNLTVGVLELFQQHLFRGLRWIGVGSTPMDKKKEVLKSISEMRPGLTICSGDCELGCKDGWQFEAQLID